MKKRKTQKILKKLKGYFRDEEIGSVVITGQDVVGLLCHLQPVQDGLLGILGPVEEVSQANLDGILMLVKQGEQSPPRSSLPGEGRGRRRVGFAS